MKYVNINYLLMNNYFSPLNYHKLLAVVILDWSFPPNHNQY